MPMKIADRDELPPVRPDNPVKSRTPEAAATGAVAAAPAAPKPRAPRARRERAPAATMKTAPSGVGEGTLEAALGSKQTAVTNRIATELWEQLGARAEELGMPIRPLLTDAVLAALELSPEEHAERVRATRRREQLSRLDREL